MIIYLEIYNKYVELGYNIINPESVKEHTVAIKFDDL